MGAPGLGHSCEATEVIADHDGVGTEAGLGAGKIIKPHGIGHCSLQHDDLEFMLQLDVRTANLLVDG